jgi:energy-coupling factor transporter ATP-binding protein EcfA2
MIKLRYRSGWRSPRGVLFPRLAAGAALMVVAACSSSGSGGSGSGGSPNSGSPIKIGLITSLSGALAPQFAGVNSDFKARIDVANAAGGVDGHKIEVSIADDAGSLQGNLTAAQSLVQSDHVLAVADESVQDNLHMFFRSAGRAGKAASIRGAYEMFPRPAERRRQTAGTLSGGEQQTLALARVLVGGSRLVIADEPSIGLAPRLVDMVFDALATARAAGVSIVLIEQYAHRALAFADSAVILRRGRVTWSGAAAAAGAQVLTHYLGEEQGEE